MKNVKFNICCTKTTQFTSNQTTKVQKGIEILERIVNSETFVNQIRNFTWTAPNGTTYNRFHLSNGLSNKQVLNCLQNGTLCWNTEIENTININVLPCTSAAQMTTILSNPSICMPTSTGRTTVVGTTTTNPTICLNANCLNDSNYTPVHVACALMHDYCVNLGFTCCTTGTIVNHTNCTIPVACCAIVMNSCKEVCADDVEVINHCNTINPATFDCCPCSTTLGTGVTGLIMPTTTACTQLDTVIGCLATELDCLTNLTNKTSDEVNRMTTISNGINSLNALKTNLQVTSLDACDVIGTTVATTTARPQVA